jgi:putative addiction module antidote
MAKALKIRKIGNALGVILPKHLLEYLGAGEGDVLYAMVTANGIGLSGLDPMPRRRSHPAAPSCAVIRTP